jgi:hypothetical protein
MSVVVEYGEKQQILGSVSPESIIFQGGVMIPASQPDSWMRAKGAFDSVNIPGTDFALGKVGLVPGEPEEIAMAFKIQDYQRGFETIEALLTATVTFINPKHPTANLIFKVGDEVTISCFTRIHPIGIDCKVEKKT